MEQLENTQTVAQTNLERWLRLFLRLVGTTTLFALVAVVMPYSWMDAIHQLLGMGKLPSEPVVGYLAPSTSAFYAMLGGLLWTSSFQLQRSLHVLGYLGKVMVVFGIVLFCIDWLERMPWFWLAAEGPVNIALGLILLILRARLRPAVSE